MACCLLSIDVTHKITLVTRLSTYFHRYTCIWSRYHLFLNMYFEYASNVCLCEIKTSINKSPQSDILTLHLILHAVIDILKQRNPSQENKIFFCVIIKYTRLGIYWCVSRNADNHNVSTIFDCLALFTSKVLHDSLVYVKLTAIICIEARYSPI